MFAAANPFGGLAMDDLAAARTFYGETLGMRMYEEGGALGAAPCRRPAHSGLSKPDHTPASFTILNVPVDDIDQALDELTARGVPIQRYEGFQTDARGIYRGQGGIRSRGMRRGRSEEACLGADGHIGEARSTGLRRS